MCKVKEKASKRYTFLTYSAFVDIKQGQFVMLYLFLLIEHFRE